MEGGQSLEETHVVTPMFKGKSSADEGGIDCIWLYITDLQLMIIYALRSNRYGYELRRCVVGIGTSRQD